MSADAGVGAVEQWEARLLKLSQKASPHLWPEECAELAGLLGHLRALAAQAEAGAGLEGAAEVWAIRQEANRLPAGTSIHDLSSEEDEARDELMRMAEAYSTALDAAEDVPEIQPLYRAALARFRTFRPAQAQAGGEG